MAKHEHKFGKNWKDRDIIASGTLEPEDIDIRNIYPFKGLHWVIYKRSKLFHILLLGESPVPGSNREVILCKVSFAHIKS